MRRESKRPHTFAKYIRLIMCLNFHTIQTLLHSESGKYLKLYKRIERDALIIVVSISHQYVDYITLPYKLTLFYRQFVYYITFETQTILLYQSTHKLFYYIRVQLQTTEVMNYIYNLTHSLLNLSS